MDEKRNLPTEDECWAEFREVMADMLANLYRQGWRAEDSVPTRPTLELVAA